jgi:hypothetical protein
LIFFIPGQDDVARKASSERVKARRDRHSCRVSYVGLRIGMLRVVLLLRWNASGLVRRRLDTAFNRMSPSAASSEMAGDQGRMGT